VTAPAQPCVITPATAVLASVASAATPITTIAWHCHWCGVRCKPRVRLGFLRHSRPSHHGHSP
jgi:hypothetical protein